MCGKAVCGECSSKKINDKRACDICFYRTKNNYDKILEDYLDEKKRQIEDYHRQIEENQKRYEEMCTKKTNLEKIVSIDLNINKL